MLAKNTLNTKATVAIIPTMDKHERSFGVHKRAVRIIRTMATNTMCHSGRIDM
jgi:hypothetical protein